MTVECRLHGSPLHWAAPIVVAPLENAPSVMSGAFGCEGETKGTCVLGAAPGGCCIGEAFLCFQEGGQRVLSTTKPHPRLEDPF